MHRTLLLTTGTSIANGTTALRSYQARASTWEEDTGDLRQQIRERLAAFDLSSESGLVSASAELNILHRLPVNPDEEVVLFSTDTAEGRCCTEELRHVIENDLGVARVKVERVEGLQVRDPQALKSNGLINLSRLLIGYLNDPQRQYAGGCVLCPNGGFKGVVPFMAVLGMIFRAPVVYVFEYAETVISLPPLPIELANDLFERALPALDWARNEVVFAVDEFHRRIPGFTQDDVLLMNSFLEITADGDGGRLGSLSPLIAALTRQEAAGTSLRISEFARRDLEGLDANERREVEHHLAKLKSALWRSQHGSLKSNNAMVDLEYYPRGHNPWRFAGYTEAGIFHLCWFAQHDSYKRLMAQPARQRHAFPPDQFTDYVPQAGSSPEADRADPYTSRTWYDLRQEIEDLKEQHAALASKESVALGNANRMQKQLHESRRTIDQLNIANRALLERLQQLEQPQGADASGASVPLE
jgi:putative CRISPR-associated protein (TIGR02619 family)